MKKYKNINFTDPNEVNKYMRYSYKVVDLHSHLEIREYKETMLKLKPDREKLPPKKATYKRGAKKVVRIDSLLRSWNNLKYSALANQLEWRSFITLTFAENITDLDKANAMFNDYTTQIRKKFPSFMYVGVIEFQKRSAIHYHLITNISPGSELMPLKPLKRLWNKGLKKYIDLKYYDLPHWSKGYSTAFGFDSVDDKFSVVGYLAKYFYKGLKDTIKALENESSGSEGEGSPVIDNRLYNRVKVLKSRNLLKPEISFIDDIDLNDRQALDDLKKFKLVHKSDLKSKSKFTPSLTYTLYHKVIDN